MRRHVQYIHVFENADGVVTRYIEEEVREFVDEAALDAWCELVRRREQSDEDTLVTFRVWPASEAPYELRPAAALRESGTLGVRGRGAGDVGKPDAP